MCDILLSVMNFRNPIPRIAGIVGGLMAFGTFGYYLLFNGREHLMDCLYMTVISLTTVGYGEILNVRAVPGARLFTMVLITGGMGILIYALSSLTAFIVEGQFTGLIRRSRMMKQIEHLQGHTIVCGGGSTGYHVAGELLKCGRRVVVVDVDPKPLERCRALGDVLTVEGDATEDRNLRDAGIERASGLVAALHSDKDNLFVVMSAQILNPDLRIVALAHDEAIEAKMKKAGADAVVSPYFIGGLRMASELVRPTTTQFLDTMLRAESGTIRISEIAVAGGSPFIGKSLKDLDLPRKHNLLVLAVIERDRKGFLYNPPAGHMLADGQTLVVMGDVKDVNALSK
jgi:voltage-gated potassium channel